MPNDDFKMVVSDLFSIAGRGTVVRGAIQTGSIRIGDTIFIHTKKGQIQNCQVKGIEKLRKMVDQASTGDSVGLLLEGIDKNDIERGAVITK